MRTRDELPTIAIANSPTAFGWLVIWLMVMGSVLIYAWGEQGPSIWIGLGGVVVVVLMARALWMLLDRRPRLIIGPHGVEVIAMKTGLIRWHNILHLEFTPGQRRNEGFVTIYYALEPGQPPPGVKDTDPPVVFAGDPNQNHAQVWLMLTILEYKPRDIFAELEARRDGGSGPLTKKLFPH